MTCAKVVEYPLGGNTVAFTQLYVDGTKVFDDVFPKDVIPQPTEPCKPPPPPCSEIEDEKKKKLCEDYYKDHYDGEIPRPSCKTKEPEGNNDYATVYSNMVGNDEVTLVLELSPDEKRLDLKHSICQPDPPGGKTKIKCPYGYSPNFLFW